MTVEQVGSFRTRPTGDGSLEVWARGWRLESPLYALIPVGLALGFVLAPMPLPMRAVGAVVLLGAALFVFRLQKPGLLFAEDAVTIVGVVRTRRYPWDGVSGFMGERRHDEGRVLLVLEGDEHVALPGTLDPSELDPYGEEGEMLSAVDQLNRLGERARSAQLPKAVSPVAAAPKPAQTERSVRLPKLPKRAARPDVAGTAPAPGSAPPEPARTSGPSRAASDRVQPTGAEPVRAEPPMDLLERPTPPSTSGNRPFVIKAPPPLEDAGPPTRKQRRAERQELKRALRSVKITKDGRAVVVPPAARESIASEPRRRLRGRREPVESVGPEPSPEPAAPDTPSRPHRRQSQQQDTGRASHYPQPTYIPQEEYARMLREQRAAEKAAAAAAAELSELADADDPADPAVPESGGG